MFLSGVWHMQSAGWWVWPEGFTDTRLGWAAAIPNSCKYRACLQAGHRPWVRSPLASPLWSPHRADFTAIITHAPAGFKLAWGGWTAQVLLCRHTQSPFISPPYHDLSLFLSLLRSLNTHVHRWSRHTCKNACLGPAQNLHSSHCAKRSPEGKLSIPQWAKNEKQ